MNVVLVQENMYMNRFIKAGATSPEHAMTLDTLGCKPNLAFKKLLGRHVIIKMDDNKYYMNLDNANSFIAARRKYSFYILMVVFVALLLFTLFANL